MCDLSVFWNVTKLMIKGYSDTFVYNRFDDVGHLGDYIVKCHHFGDNVPPG